MSHSNGSSSNYQRTSTSNGHQQQHGLSTQHVEQDTELALNGQDGMELERDDAHVGGAGRQRKMAVRREHAAREGDIGLGLSNHFNSDDLPSPYLRTQFPPHSPRSYCAPGQTHTARMNDRQSPRSISSPVKSGRSPSPANSIPPASPLQAHIAPAAAAPPSKPRYAQPTPTHDLSSRPYSSYTPGQGSSRPTAHINQGDGSRAGYRKDIQEEQAGEDVLPTRKALGNLWKRDFPEESVGETEVREDDVEMGEEKEDMELDELESEADKGDTGPAVVTTAAAVPKPRTARTPRNRKPGRNANGKKDEERVKPKEVEEDKENLEVRAGDKEGKGEFAYEYVAISQRKEGRQNM